MDIDKNAKILRKLRKAKGMTQKDVADRLGVLPKTVSKWETGHGFPDVCVISELAEILGTNEKTLLRGEYVQNAEQNGNMQRLKFYVCPHCTGITYSMGEAEIMCCGKKLLPQHIKSEDDGHIAVVKEDAGEVYISFNHEMTKEHYIVFAAYVSYDRVLIVRLYPEQESEVRFSKSHGGNLYFYCSKHGLFLHKNKKEKEKGGAASLTAKLSAFARAYHSENDGGCVFNDSCAKSLFSETEYSQIEGYIKAGGHSVRNYVNAFLAPTPLARAAFTKEALDAAIKTGTSQYVILGSGFDTDFMRRHNIEIFEVDKKETLDDKMQRLSRAGFEAEKNVHFVPVRLGRDNLLKALEKHGFDKTKKTFFSCMGLIYYLEKEEAEKMLSDIASFSADGSSIAFDIGDGHLFSANEERVRNMLDMAQASGEPMKTAMSYPEIEETAQKCGLLIYEFLNAAQIQERFFSGKTKDISAFEHICFALAVVKK